MFRSVLVSCFLVLACRMAIAEEGAILPEPQAQAEPQAKHGDVQLNDIVVVVLDHNLPSNDRAAVRDQAPHRERIAASVAKIQPNGDLVIEGRTEIAFEGKILDQSLTGVVHRKSLGVDRTVRQQDVSEFRLSLRKKDIVQNDSGLSVAMPYPVRQVSAQSPVPPLIAVLRQKQMELDQLQQEVRKLRAETGAPQQIVVRVQMVEVSLTKLEKLGLDVSSVDSGRVDVNNVSGLAKAFQIFSGGDFTQLPANEEPDGAQRLINMLAQHNVAKILSEPTVVAMDGQPAMVHVGGEIPYPVIGGAKGAVENRPIGSQVDVVPMTLGENHVRLDLRMRASDVDYSLMQEINGVRAPLIHVRQCSTAIESAFGVGSSRVDLQACKLEYSIVSPK